MPITPTPKIWMNGDLVDWDQARIHVLTHTLHYGTGVFEGIRAYETSQGPAIFRLTDHIVRLHNSAKILGMELPYTVDELVEACKATVASTGLPACYVRPIAYLGYGEMGLNTLPCSVDVAIACWPWGAYLGDDAVTKGVRMKISSWTRHDHNTMPPAAKTIGNYVNSSLAKVEALNAGYDEAIMLAPNGLVAECTGENIFVSRNDVLLTPPLSAGALEGITQSSVMTIARDLGIDCRVDNIARSDLYIAEEIFVCGTAAEVSSVNSVDDRADPLPRPQDDGHRRDLRPRRPRRGAAVQGVVRTRRVTFTANRGRDRASGMASKITPRTGFGEDRAQMSAGREKANCPGSAAAGAAALPRAAQGGTNHPPMVDLLALAFRSTSHRPSCPKARRAMPRSGPVPVTRPVTARCSHAAPDKSEATIWHREDRGPTSQLGWLPGASALLHASDRPANRPAIRHGIGGIRPVHRLR